MAELDPTVVDKPIVVPDSAMPEIVITILRYALTAIGGILVTKGWFTDAAVNDIVGAILLIVPTVYGAWKTKHNQSKLQTVAADRRVPNSIITLKSETK